MRVGIVELYCGQSGKKGYYNSQEIGLAKALNKLGYEVVIFYPKLGISVCLEEIIEDRIKVIYVPARAIGNHSFYNWNVLLQYRIDVVQIGSDNQIFAPWLMRFCDRKGIKSYNYIGTIESDSDNLIKKKIMSILFARNVKAVKKHKCFAKTRSVYAGLREKGITDIDVANVGLDVSVIPYIKEETGVIRKRLNIPDNRIILLFVGRMEPYKRPLKALEMLRELPEDFYLVMIGSGRLDGEVCEYIEDNYLSNRVSRVKSVRNDDIHEYYKAADYFLNFNEQEIFGMSVLEAMYQDCTVIAINAPGPSEIIQNEADGYLVQDITEMKTIILNREKIKTGRAKRTVVKHFTWDATAKKIDYWIKGTYIRCRS